jgi:hypothetical protein
MLLSAGCCCEVLHVGGFVRTERIQPTALLNQPTTLLEQCKYVCWLVVDTFVTKQLFCYPGTYCMLGFVQHVNQKLKLPQRMQDLMYHTVIWECAQTNWLVGRLYGNALACAYWPVHTGFTRMSTPGRHRL